MAQWQAMLPGFDATWHELGPVAVIVDGVHAVATAPVTGTHLLGGEAWVVSGRYRVELLGSGSRWRITGLTYSNEREEGDRGLTEQAKARSAAS